MVEIKNKSLNRLLNEVIENNFKTEIEGLGFKHLKTKNSFQIKKGDLVLNIHYAIDYWDKYYIDDDGELILNIDFISSVSTTGFSNWYKKNYEESWGFNQVFNKIKLFYLLENPNVGKDDFSSLTPIREYKKNISNLLHQSSSTKSDLELISDSKSEILTFLKTNIIPNLLNNSNWDYLLNKIKGKKDFQVCYAFVYLLFYLNKIDESREAFDSLLKNHYEKLSNNEIKDVKDFKRYITQREKEYKTMFNS